MTPSEEAHDLRPRVGIMRSQKMASIQVSAMRARVQKRQRRSRDKVKELQKKGYAVLLQECEAYGLGSQADLKAHGTQALAAKLLQGTFLGCVVNLLPPMCLCPLAQEAQDVSDLPSDSEDEAALKRSRVGLAPVAAAAGTTYLPMYNHPSLAPPCRVLPTPQSQQQLKQVPPGSLRCVNLLLDRRQQATHCLQQQRRVGRMFYLYPRTGLLLLGEGFRRGTCCCFPRGMSGSMAALLTQL